MRSGEGRGGSAFTTLHPFRSADPEKGKFCTSRSACCVHFGGHGVCATLSSGLLGGPCAQVASLGWLQCTQGASVFLHRFPFSVGKCPEVELLGRVVVLAVSFEDPPDRFQSGGTRVQPSQQCTRAPRPPRPRQHLFVDRRRCPP